MRSRAILTAIWLASLAAAVFLVEWSVHTFRIVEQQRVDCLAPLLKFYGAYLASILSFWYFGRLPQLGGARLENVRFALACVCTMLLNSVLLYVSAGVYLRGTNDLTQDIQDAVRIAALLSFLVAPVNLYYFGMKHAKE